MIVYILELSQYFYRFVTKSYQVTLYTLSLFSQLMDNQDLNNLNDPS